MVDIVKLIFASDSSQIKKSTKDVKDLDKSSGGASKSVKGLSTAFKAFAVGAAAAVAIGKAVSVLAEMGKAAINTADALAKTATKLGLTAVELQELRIRADAASVGVAALEVGFQRFTRRMDEARGGAGKLAERFKELNISLVDQEGNFKSNIDVFNEFGIAVGKIEDASRAVAVTFDAVDTEGVNLINVFRQTADEQEEITKSAERYGSVIENSIIKQLEDYATELALIEGGTARLELQRDAALAPLAVAWAEIKNEIAFATLEVLTFFGAIDKSAALARTEIARLEEEIKELDLEERAGPSEGLILAGTTVEDFKLRKLDLITEKENELLDLRAQLVGLTKLENEAQDIRLAKAKVLRAEQQAAFAEQRKQFKDLADAEIEKLKAEQDAVKAKAAAERNAIRDAEKLIANTKREADATAALAESWRLAIDPARQFAQMQVEIDILLEKGAITADEYAEAVDVIAERTKAAAETSIDPIQEMIDRLFDMETQLKRMKVEGIEGLADSIADFVITGKANFKEFAVDFLKQISKMIIKALIFRAIMSVLGLGGGRAASASSFSIPTIAGQVDSGVVGPPVGADSGAIVNAGQPVLIGTGAQPELFIPTTAGSLVPRNMQRGGVSIGNINVTIKEDKTETPAQQAQRISRAITQDLNALINRALVEQLRPGNILSPAPISTFK